MVGINFKKKVINTVYLETYTSYKEYKETHKLKVPLDSFICYSIYKFCNSNFVVIRFVPIRIPPENEKPAFTIVEAEGEEFIFLINEYEIPWTVALCAYPVIMSEDVIVTGLSAVARQICLFRNSYALRQEHDDGLLGFRHTCLQAPNETSVWTKFCEIEIINSVQELLKTKDIKIVPIDLVRFEHHLKQPVRIHNVYKVAQNKKKQQTEAQTSSDALQATDVEPQATSVESEAASAVLPVNAEQQLTTEPQAEHEISDNNQKILKQQTNVKQQASTKQQTQCEKQVKAKQVEETAESNHLTNAEQQAIADKQDPIESSEGPSGSPRTPKSRKWKSLKKKEPVVDCSTKLEDLEVSHEFAEGPFLTLADLVLLPSYHIMIWLIGETQFESLLPLTYKWYKNLINIPKIQETFGLFMNQPNLKQLSLENMTLPKVTDKLGSLYKCDPKRQNPKSRFYTRNDEVIVSLSSITEGMELILSENEIEPSFRWKDIPEQANPFSGFLPDTRVQRKSEQLQNLAQAVLGMATDGDVIVDFCCGGGHLGILLAYLLPKCTIILLENKVHSLCKAKERVKKMNLTNVYYYQCNLDFFIGEFDIGIGLHACGVATDLILDKCIKQNARFVISPCCYGAIHETDRIEYPRSKMFSSVPFNRYLFIAHAADQTHYEHPLAVRGARCMVVIDSDRARYAEEFGYKVTLTSLKPITCTPKNNLLIGISTEK